MAIATDHEPAPRFCWLHGQQPGPRAPRTPKAKDSAPSFSGVRDCARLRLRHGDEPGVHLLLGDLTLSRGAAQRARRHVASTGHRAEQSGPSSSDRAQLRLVSLFSSAKWACSATNPVRGTVGAGPTYSERDLGSPSPGCGAAAQWPCLEPCPASQPVACHQIGTLANVRGS